MPTKNYDSRAIVYLAGKRNNKVGKETSGSAY